MKKIMKEMNKCIEYNMISLNNLTNPEKYNFISNLAITFLVIQKCIKRDFDELNNQVLFPIEFIETSNNLIVSCDKFIDLFDVFEKTYEDKSIEIFSLQKNNVISVKQKCIELKKVYYDSMPPETRKKLDEIEEKNKEKPKVYIKEK